MDQRVDARAVDPEKQRRGRGQHDDPVREDEPVAEIRELAGEVAVVRQQRGEPGEALVGRVRGQDEDEQGQPLDRVEHEGACGAGGEGRAGDLRDDGDGRARPSVHVDGQERHAHEERDRERAEHAEGLRGVPALRVPEGVDAVRDRLHARERGRTGRERPQQDERRDSAHPRRERMRHRRRGTGAGGAAREPRADEGEHRRHERVGREREEDPRLADTSEVRHGDQDHAGEREHDLVRRKRGRDRRDREDARRDRDDVVRQERGRCDEARKGAQVLLGDDVRAAARLVRADGLAVREHDDREQRRDPEREREDEPGRGRGHGDEHDERRLRRVGDRRERVGGEDRERERLREERVLELGGCHRAADDDALERLGAPSGRLGRRRRDPRHRSAPGPRGSRAAIVRVSAWGSVAARPRS